MTHRPQPVPSGEATEPVPSPAAASTHESVPARVTGPRRSLARCVMATLLVLGSCAVLTLGTSTPASALCASSNLTGDWHNIDAGSRSMTRIIVETCQPVVTCNGDICQIAHDSGTFTTPFGSCHPTDCNWGRRQASHEADGWIRTVYPFGFKTSHVWAKTYQYYGLTYLRLWVYNDFTPADGRADYTTDQWFLK